MLWKRVGLLIVLLLFVTAPVVASTAPCHDRTSKCMNKLDKMLRERGWAGLEMQPASGGALEVVRVLDESPAKKAGFLQGDVVVAIDGERIAGAGDEALARLLKDLKPGAEVLYTITRGGSESELSVKLGTIPQYVRTRWISKYTNGESTAMEFS